MTSPNQNPEQLARDRIDQMLIASGWVVQSKRQINLQAAKGVAIREYQTDVGPADYAISAHTMPHKTKDTNRKLSLRHGKPEEHQRRELSYAMIRDLAERIKTSKPTLAPLQVWRAYEQLEEVKGQPKNELIALVSLVRTISGADTGLTPFDKTVDKNFQDWIFKKQAGTTKYTTEQVWGLRMIKDYIANSFHVDRDDFELDPFNKQGSLGKIWKLFGDETDRIIELNERLVA